MQKMTDKNIAKYEWSATLAHLEILSVHEVLIVAY